MRSLSMVAVLLGALVWVASAGADDLELGRQVYAKNCASCHGTDGKGNTKVEKMLKARIPPLANAATKADAGLLKLVSEGKKPMPAFATRLSKDELEAVVHFVKGLATGQVAGGK